MVFKYIHLVIFTIFSQIIFIQGLNLTMATDIFLKFFKDKVKEKEKKKEFEDNDEEEENEKEEIKEKEEDKEKE